MMDFWLCSCGKKVSVKILTCPYCKTPAGEDVQRKHNPNLTNCRCCKKTVSKTANVCPYCGCKNPGLSEGSYTIGLTISIIFAVFISLTIFTRCQRTNEDVQKHLDNASKAAEEAEKNLKDAEDRLNRYR